MNQVDIQTMEMLQRLPDSEELEEIARTVHQELFHEMEDLLSAIDDVIRGDWTDARKVMAIKTFMDEHMRE